MKVTKDLLKCETQEFDIETIFTLVLRQRGIFDLGCLGDCINLITLDLSFNKISSVLALRTLCHLEVLNLSSNRLSALSGIEELVKLEFLDVSGNMLNSMDCLLPLTKVDSLRSLRLKDGQESLTNLLMLENEDNVEKCITNMLPQLHVLNDIPIKGRNDLLNTICEKLISSKQDKIVTDESLFAWKPSYVCQDFNFIRVGFEKNETYDRAIEVADECSEIANELRRCCEKIETVDDTP